MFAQQMPVQQIAQPNVGAFSQNNFPTQQLNDAFPMGTRAGYQIPQMCINPQIDNTGANPIAIGKMNGQMNSAMTIPAQMVC